MPPQCEMLLDRPEAREEFLRAFRVAKVVPATLAFASWLVTVLRTVVQAVVRFNEHMLHVHQLSNFRLCGRITSQLIGDDLAQHRARAQHTLEEPIGYGLVAPFLLHDAEFGAVLVDRAPRQVQFATQRDEHLVEAPRAPRTRGRRLLGGLYYLARFAAATFIREANSNAAGLRRFPLRERR